MKKLLLPLILTILLSQFCFSQDKIYRKNGKVVQAKILEVGPDEIKYREFNSPDGPIYILETERIIKIVYENGKVENFTPNLKDPERYSGQLRKAIKIDFLGPLIGYSQISFEKSTAVGRGYEVTLGIIGAGKNQRVDYYYNSIQLERRNQFGITSSFGFKFNKLPDFLFGHTRFTHLMQGSYAKPIIYIGNYSEDRLVNKGNNVYVVDRPNITFGALQVEFGKQWVFGDKFLIDGYWGLGYGFDNKKSDGNYVEDGGAAFNYINARAGRSPGFSLTYGIKIGLLIK